MKLSEFSIKQRNIANDGEPEKMGEWKPASGGAMVALAERAGKKYQIKLRAGKPKWFETGKVIRSKQEKRAASTDDEEKERLQREIDSLKRSEARHNENDRLADEFVAAKNAIFARINSAGDPRLVCADAMWKEATPMKGNVIFSYEATPWVEEAIGFDGARIDFRRDLTVDQKYGIIAELAETLALLHSKGVVHGDLKIGNTVITKVGGDYKVSLIDFDAAFILDDLHAKRHARETWELIVGGTYFSPEALELYETVNEKDDEEYEAYDFGKITAKSDIFSLGVTVYEYLYERADFHIMPFIGPDRDKLTINEYGKAVAAGYRPDFPKETDCPTMDGLVYGMLNWMLAADPAKRPDATTVAEVFRSRDESKIPPEYRRIDNSVPWEEDQIDFVPKDGVRVEKGTRTGRYRIIRNGTGVSADAARLIADGLARYRSEPADGTAHPDLMWGCDGEERLPACIRRSVGNEGKYTLTQGYVKKVYTMSELKRIGFFCSEEELIKLWPADAAAKPDLKAKIGYVIKRDFSRGPGNYIVLSESDYRSGRTMSYSTIKFDSLVSSGYAACGASVSEPWREDGVCFVLSAISSDVVSVTRHVLRGPGFYVINRSNGTSERGVPVQKLLDLGWVKKV